MQKITVPYRITKRMQSAMSYQPSAMSYACNSEPGIAQGTVPDLRTEQSGVVESGLSPLSGPNYASLFEEVMGYGGSGCFNATAIITSGGYICCPYAAQQTTCSTSTSFIIGYPTGCGSGGGGGTVYFGGGSGGSGGQGGGGGIPKPKPQPIQTGTCECMNCDDNNPCTTDYCVDGVCYHDPKPDGTSCPDDGDICTYDRCSNAVCTHPSKLRRDCEEELAECAKRATENELECLKNVAEYATLCYMNCPIMCVLSGPDYPACVAICEAACFAGQEAAEALCHAAYLAELGICYINYYACLRKPCI
jgi:hypothetical protein